MNIYHLIRPLLFQLPAETAHNVTLKALKWIPDCCFAKIPAQPVQLMGLTFPNRIGLAAGLDKNGDYIDALAKLGFGFIEIGTVTPRPQPGNPLPRLFRIAEAQALINRMGFNNNGIDYLIEQRRAAKFNGVIGINIGKNKETPLENAFDDYQIALQKAYPYADYITINISSPNTEGLRELQGEKFLSDLISKLKQEQFACQQQYAKYVPLVIKIAPDLSSDDIQFFAEVCLQHNIDGIIATNTTLDHQAVTQYPQGNEQGGLSGAPLTASSTAVIKQLHAIVGDRIPIIGVGGIMSGQDAVDKIKAGASLIQVYSGLIYHGQGLVTDIARSLILP